MLYHWLGFSPIRHCLRTGNPGRPAFPSDLRPGRPRKITQCDDLLHRAFIYAMEFATMCLETPECPIEAAE
jgi:hypothetical protein